MPVEEVLVSVDVEASGASPSTGSLIAIGACLVDDPSVNLYLELKPLPGLPWSDDAERIHGLSRAHLEANGLEPAPAMERLARWVNESAAGRQAVFIGFNAAFDWMFVTDYLHRFTGRNPFGHSALDIKAYFMGRRNLSRWADTGYEAVARALQLGHGHTHHALDDAQEQAEIMRVLARQ